MPKYITRGDAAGWCEDYLLRDQQWSLKPELSVDSFDPTPTGILTVNGDMIYKRPPEIGFGRNID